MLKQCLEMNARGFCMHVFLVILIINKIAKLPLFDASIAHGNEICFGIVYMCY